MRSERETVPAWRGDWHARVLGRIRLLGFRTVRGFLEANPGIPYYELARMISEEGDVAPVQMEQLHKECAGDSEQSIRSEALHSMTRFLRGALKEGWGRRRHWQTDVIGALVFWSGVWGRDVRLKKVEEALFALNPPVGWIPEPSGDRLLIEAFDRGWPINTKTHG